MALAPARDIDELMAADIRANRAALRREGDGDAALEEAVRQFTQAELELMERQEGIEFTDDDASLPGLALDAGHQQTVWKIGKGQSQFTGIMLDYTGSRERVNLYDTVTGQPYAVASDRMEFYLAKRDPKTGEAIFQPRPLVKQHRPVRCDSKLSACRKMFVSEYLRDEHFRHRHPSEWANRERERSREREERLIKIQEQQTELLARVLSGQSLDPESAAVLAEAAKMVNAELVPDLTWNRHAIVTWGMQRDLPYGAEQAALNDEELLVSWGLRSPEPAAAQEAG